MSRNPLPLLIALVPALLSVPAPAAERVDLSSERRGLYEAQTKTTSEDEFLARLAGLRSRCGEVRKESRFIVIADLRDRLLLRRLETFGDVRFVDLRDVGAASVVRQTNEFRFCGTELALPLAWDPIRNGAALLARDLGFDIDKPLFRMTAVHDDPRGAMRYLLVSNEPAIRQGLALLPPGTPLHLEFVITSVAETEVRGVLIRAEQVGEAPPAGSWTPAIGSPADAPPASIAASTAPKAGVGGGAWRNLPTRDSSPSDEADEPRPKGDHLIKLNESFELAVGERARLGDKSPLSIRVARVVDKTDCTPEGACKRGPADVHLDLVAATGQKGSIVFESPTNNPIELPLGGFRLRLLRVSPRPDLYGPVPESKFRTEMVVDLGKLETLPSKKAPSSSRRADDIWWWFTLLADTIPDY
jgi:hypothetical protein